jgi:ribonucleoside-diphosphate reductase alpha chain
VQSTLGDFASKIHAQKYALKDSSGKPIESWPDTASRVASNVLGAIGYGPRSDEVREIERLITARKFLPGGRYLYAAGRDLHQVNNCLLLRCEDSREGWAALLWQATMALMTGAGIGVDYSHVRPRGSSVHRTGGHASGPLSPMRIINELGRDVMQGGSRRSAIWAGLNWRHPDIMDFITVKDWDDKLRALKERDWTLPMEMELTNISVILDDDFFAAIESPAHPDHEHASRVYSAALSRMLKTGEPGFSVDTGENAGETLRNACTEVTSADDSDICNLGSINLGRIESRQELKSTIELATLFLLAGTVYSDVPYVKVDDVRTKNRRLGLGLMGVHDWLLQRGLPYGPNGGLGLLLEEYARCGVIADSWADALSLSRPVKTRAIAPNGTIGIIAETTTGIEPIFCTAYERTYLVGREWRTETVVDPVAESLVRRGVDPDDVEDAYSLSADVKRRLGMQAWVQQYVDHGISSTVNLPAPITDPAEVATFGETLLNFLPYLRGVTAYPNGARAGQPIKAVPLVEALRGPLVIDVNEETCVGGICGV